MISDVLFEAIAEIEQWQERVPFAYHDYKQEIATVKRVMRRLQNKLDTNPVDDDD
jgi:hypothetical protein